MKDNYQRIFEYLDVRVVGHLEAKKKLAMLGALYLKRCEVAQDGFFKPTDLPRLNSFIVGQTGTGKTYLASLLAEAVGYPFIRIDCSALSQEGWHGTALSEYLRLVKSDAALAQGCVIMLDEMDKLAGGTQAQGGRVPAEGVQHNLLDLLDGRYTKETQLQHLSNALIVCSGAFHDVIESISTPPKTIGFKGAEEIKQNHNWREIIQDAGILPEVAGRIVDVVVLDTLTKEDVKTLLTSKQGTALHKYRYLDPNFFLTDAEIDQIAQEVVTSKLGMRTVDTCIYNIVSARLQNKFTKPKV